MEHKQNITPPYKLGVDIPQNKSLEVWNFVVSRGLEDLKGTAFVTGEKFTPADIEALKGFYQEVFDYQERIFGSDGAVFNASLREHLQLSERIAQKMAPVLDLDVNLLSALVLIHDFGRLFSHRRGRNDLIGGRLEEKLGFNREFTSLLPVDALWVDMDQESVMNTLTAMTKRNKGVGAAITLIDVMGKWKNKSVGKLRDYEDVVPLAKKRQNQPSKDDMWPSEYSRQKKIVTDRGDEFISVKYDYLKNWFEEKMEMKIDEFIGDVEESLRADPLKESWV